MFKKYRILRKLNKQFNQDASIKNAEKIVTFCENEMPYRIQGDTTGLLIVSIFIPAFFVSAVCFGVAYSYGFLTYVPTGAENIFGKMFDGPPVVSKAMIVAVVSVFAAFAYDGLAFKNYWKIKGDFKSQH